MVEKLHEFEETIDPIVQLFEDPEVQEYLEQKKCVRRRVYFSCFFFNLRVLHMCWLVPPLHLYVCTIVTLFFIIFFHSCFLSSHSPLFFLREDLTLFEYLSQNHDVR